MPKLTAEQFDSLYRHHGRRAQGFFLRMTGYDRSLAEDLTQELFTRIWEHRDDYRDEQSFTTWMYTIAYNLCKNVYRHRTVAETYLQDAQSTVAEEAPVSDELERTEQRALLPRPSEACRRNSAKCSCCATRRVSPSRMSPPSAPFPRAP